MELIRCVNAYTAAAALSQQEWDYKTAYALVMIKKKLQPQVDFYTAQEMQLVERYGERDEKGKVVLSEKGSFRFKDPEQAAEFAAKRAELGMVETEETFAPLRVPAPERIRPVYLEALEGFLEFEEGDA